MSETNLCEIVNFLFLSSSFLVIRQQPNLVIVLRFFGSIKKLIKVPFPDYVGPMIIKDF